MKMRNEFIRLSEGSGGMEMNELIRMLNIKNRGKWENYDNDSSTLDIGGGRVLVFTTDSFIVEPLFFPGADIGHIAVCGTINDLAVMGAEPLGLSLAFVIEEGFSKKSLARIMDSINKISDETRVPVVTGDTKVMQKGKLDKIIINTSGVGVAKKNELLTKSPKPGDKVIISGGLGEHAISLLSKRFDYKTSVVSDSKPLIHEIKSVKDLIKCARDITRGGLSAVLNEICKKERKGVELLEEKIPAKQEVLNAAEMLGINILELACEGRLVCFAKAENAELVEKKLQKFNKDAAIIGEITKSGKVIINTALGKRILPMPTGRIVPRIC